MIISTLNRCCCYSTAPLILRLNHNEYLLTIRPDQWMSLLLNLVKTLRGKHISRPIHVKRTFVELAANSLHSVELNTQLYRMLVSIAQPLLFLFFSLLFYVLPFVWVDYFTENSCNIEWNENVIDYILMQILVLIVEEE